MKQGASSDSRMRGMRLRLWKVENTGHHERDDRGEKSSKISITKVEVQARRRKENY